MESEEDGKQEERTTAGDPWGRPRARHPTYPEEVEADGAERLPGAVPVPGLLEQGHQHAAGHWDHPVLLRPPDGQQKLRVPPKCVSG